MRRVTFINHKGREILFLNFADCRSDEVLMVIEEARKVIRERPEHSLLTLTDVSTTRFNDKVSQVMKEFTAHNKPYVAAAAVVGITGIKKVIFEAVLAFSRRKLHTFKTLEQAKDWLAAN